MSVNKEDFDKIYDLGFIKVYAPKKSGYSGAKTALQNAIEVFDIKDLSDIHVNPSPDYNPYIDVLKDLLYGALPQGPLWNGIFRIEQSELGDSGIHGSLKYKTSKKYSMRVKSREEQLESINSNWIYENHKEVSEFMKDSEGFYGKLLDFSQKNFPIVLSDGIYD